MYRVKAFFYVCAGLFLLALAYHLGARSAGAQANSPVSGIAFPNGTSGFYVFTPSGDCYYRYADVGGFTGDVRYLGNFWSGPTPAQRETFGALKSRYRGERGAAQPTEGR